MIEIGTRTRNQPAPPPALFAELTEPDRDPARPWLDLHDDEVRPRVLQSNPPTMVVWSSLWVKRPDARVRFDLLSDANSQGTDLCWTLLVDEPAPPDAVVGHLRRRVNQLIHADLRYTFGQ